jgi:hypothetical protein
VTTPPRPAAGRRAPAPLRGDSPFGAALFQGHPIIARNLESLATALQLLHSLQPSIVVGLVADEVIVDDMPMAKADTMGPLVRRLQSAGVERITIDRGVTMDELVLFVEAFTSVEQDHAIDRPSRFPTMAHVRVGRVTVGQRAEGSATDMATIRRLYNDAVSAANSVYDSAQTEGKPDMSIRAHDDRRPGAGPSRTTGRRCSR